MAWSQAVGATAGVHWPRAPPGLGPPGTFHVAAPAAGPQGGPTWHRQPCALGAAAAPALAPVWGRGRPGPTAPGPRAGRQPAGPQPPLAAVLEEEEEEHGPGFSLGEEPSLAAESPREERPKDEPCEPGRQVRPSGSPAPARAGAGATSWTHSWEVNRAVLSSQSSRVASPEFQVCLPGQEPTRFVLVLSTHRECFGPVGPRAQSSFKRTKGCGVVSIKCKGGPLATSTFVIALWLEVDGQARQPRDAVHCSFSERSVCEHESWKLQQARPDQKKTTVCLQLTVATPASESLEAAQTCQGSPEAAAATGLDMGPPPGLEGLGATGGACCAWRHRAGGPPAKASCCREPSGAAAGAFRGRP